MRRHPDLVAVSGASVVAAIVVLVVPVEAVRVAVALPLCLLAPGHAVVEAAFARHTVAGTLRVLLTASMSLCVLVLGALALNELRAGIRDVTWAAGLAVVTVVCCMIAGPRRIAPGARLRLPALRRPRFADIVLVAVAVAVAVLAAAGTIARRTTAAKVAGYTQLWMLPTGKPAARRFDLGIRSAELEEHRYRLELRYGGDPERRLIVRGVELAPGEEFHRIVTPPARAAGDGREVTVLLFRSDHPNRVYRRVQSASPRVRPPLESLMEPQNVRRPRHFRSGRSTDYATP